MPQDSIYYINSSGDTAYLPVDSLKTVLPSEIVSNVTNISETNPASLWRLFL